MEKTNHIGKILHTYQNQINSEIRLWDAQLIPAINKIIEQYETFEIGEFTDKVFRSIIAGDIQPIHDKAIAYVQDQCKRLKSAILLKLSTEELNKKYQDFIKTCGEFVALKNRLPFASTMFTPTLEWSDISIINSVCIVDHEAIKKRNQIVIENQVQSELYEVLLSLQNHWNETIDFVKGMGFDTHRNGLIATRSSWGFLSLDDLNGILSIIPDQIKWAKEKVIMDESEKKSKTKQKEVA